MFYNMEHRTQLGDDMAVRHQDLVASEIVEMENGIAMKSGLKWVENKMNCGIEDFIDDSVPVKLGSQLRHVLTTTDHAKGYSS